MGTDTRLPRHLPLLRFACGVEDGLYYEQRSDGKFDAITRPGVPAAPCPPGWRGRRGT